MITANYSLPTTGANSRIQNPFAPLSPEAVRARLQPIQPPVRNVLAGPEPTSIVGRIAAWFRGER